MPTGSSLISRGRIQSSYRRIKAHKLSVCYTSSLCCQLEIAEHLKMMGRFNGLDILDFDETSCSRDKFKSTDGYETDEIVVYEWEAFKCCGNEFAIRLR